MDFAAYLDLPGESATGLKSMLVSPLAYKHARENGRPDTDALRVGRAVHSAVLEPGTFVERYVCWPGRRAGKAWEGFRAEHEDDHGRTVLSERQTVNATMISHRVRTHPIVVGLLSEGYAETTLRWIHARTGTACKARLDWYSPHALVELKTCRDPSPRPFAAAFARLHYHMQCAFYRAAMGAAGLGYPPVKIIAAQNVPPFDVAVYHVPEDVLALGEREYETALDMLVKCRETDQWPGLAHDEELTLNLPAWATNDDEGGDPEWIVGISEEVASG
jgi:hypothetical protein